MKPVVIGISKTGSPTAKTGSIRIHSSYDPDKEAQRFLLSLKEMPCDGCTIVILGAALGYLDGYFARKFPSSHIVAIHLNPQLFDNRIAETEEQRVSTDRWHPAIGIDIQDFLFHTIKEMEISGLKIYRWAPSIRAWPELAEEANGAVTTIVRRYSGNISATAAFGRLWVRNMLRNYLELDCIAQPSVVDAPVVLAASGPSLEYVLQHLVKTRSRFRLWSLPSSLPALHDAGLIPDLIFTTDSGFWARIHQRYFPPGVTVAMPLSSSVRPRRGTPTLLLPQETPGERFLLSGEKWPCLELPSMGTVAATAMEAWARLCSGPMMIVGLDLCWYDLRSHVRPHSFDGWLAARTNRMSSAQNVAWTRAMEMAPDREGRSRSGPSLRTYTDWFESSAPSGPIYRAVPGDFPGRWAPIKRIAEVDESWLSNLSKDVDLNLPQFSHGKAPENSEARWIRVRMLLNHWTTLLSDDIDFHYDEKRELLYTLDPGGVLEIERSKRSGSVEDARDRHIQRVREILSEIEPIHV
ncbi:MAG: 6-hydroxymethylpterin diphosphokinase MptE-like protein [Spirochaetaceae bacterium]|nr:DUF115 domain-containing protein [Spirochaetaceae bacterium]MDT8297314.1 6-hydroxymethylpterin diphosphokinase MptE-like protein [Spirochaetaceae bacterium]